MAEISNKDPRFLEIQEEKLKQALGLDEVEYELISTKISNTSNISPGQVVTFVYDGKQFMALAVSNARSGSNVTFRNIRTRNKLFSCFLVDHLSRESLQVLISSLNKYGKYTKIASYKYITNLFGLLIGKDRYRTFISTGRMSQLTRVMIKGGSN